jgi:hypothetical protein
LSKADATAHSRASAKPRAKRPERAPEPTAVEPGHLEHADEDIRSGLTEEEARDLAPDIASGKVVPLRRSTVEYMRDVQAAARAVVIALEKKNDDLRADNIVLAKKCARLERAHEAVLSNPAESPAFRGGLGGRTAIESLRNTNIAGFAKHLNDAGHFALAHRPEEAEHVLETGVRADAAILLASPSTEDEAERAFRLDALLSNPSIRRVLAGTGEAPERFRSKVNGEIMAFAGRNWAPELVRRSADLSGMRSNERPPSDDGD